MRKKPAERPKPAPKLCECGCGQEFTPARPWHKYIDENHRWAAWRQRNLDARAAAARAERTAKRIHKMATIEGPVTQAELEARLKKIDKYLAKRGMTATTT